MNNGKLWTIVRHEYLVKVKSKGFIISTLLAPILFAAVVGIVAFITIISEDAAAKKVAIVDYTGKLENRLVDLDPEMFFIPPADKRDPDVLRKEVLDEKLDGYFIIPKNFFETGEATVYSTGGGGIAFREKLERSVRGFFRRDVLKEAGVSDETMNLVFGGPKIEAKEIVEGAAPGEEATDFSEIRAALGYVLGLFVYGLTLVYGGLVMRGAIEEKSNRIVEIIASSARPIDIMAGKILGIGAAGLTQVLVWLTAGTVLLAILGSPMVLSGLTDSAGTSGGFSLPANFEMPQISAWVGVSFAFYFLSGYFIYASLFAAIGSAVDQESDAQQLQGPIMIPIVLPMFLIVNIMSDPNGTISTVFSLIPLFTPIIMPIRVAATNADLPFWQIALSTFLIVATFIGTIWISAKIYKVGIMIYGKKPKLKDLIKWIKMA